MTAARTKLHRIKQESTFQGEQPIAATTQAKRTRDEPQTVSGSKQQIRAVVCPVCNQELPLCIKDSDITAHIDECLARNQLLSLGPGWQ